MSEADAVTWMARLAAIAAAIAALELLCVRDQLTDRGVFAWPVLRRELAGAPWPLRWLADRVLSYPGTVGVLALQLVAAMFLPAIDHPAPAWIIAASSLAIAIRFRGAYNGGSDAMMIVVALALALAKTWPGSPLGELGVAYAAAQLVLSYFISGVAKLADPAWRTGRALPILVGLPHYRVPRAAAAVLSRAAIAAIAGWLMLVFECGAPLALTGRTACLALLAFGAGFHVVNAVVFGLNRFLWTWLAAYPALLYWAGHIT